MSNNTPLVVKNTLTNEEILQVTPQNEEVEIFNKSVLIAEFDINGILVYANSRFITLTGFFKNELIGAPIELIYHPDMPKGVFKAMWKIIPEKKIWRGYIKHLTKDGSYFWTLTYIQAKLDDRGDILGYVSIGKAAYEKPRKLVEEKYKSLMEDEFIDDAYFMLSDDYKKLEIIAKTNLDEYIVELEGLEEEEETLKES